MVDRLFQIVYLLMEKRQMTAKELSELLEVSERTIYRDMDKLAAAGIPIYASQGKNGGISILPDYVLDKTVLTAEEKERIFQSLNALNEIAFSGSGESMPESMAKLRAFFGEQYQDWIEVEFSSWGNSEEDGERFGKIKNAILRHRYLKIAYSGSQGAVTERKIKPLKLCFKDQAWYLYAYCCLREDYRFFKLKRISELTAPDECFEPETTGKVLPEAGREYIQNAVTVQVDLEIDKDMAFRAYEELTDITVGDGGALFCRVEVADMDWFVSFALSYGAHLRVLAPREVKERVIQEINKMKEMY